MRAKGFKLKIVVGNPSELLADPAIAGDLCGAMLQYPDVNGEIENWSEVTDKVHSLGGQVVVGTDLLALTMLKPPGEWGADMVLGNSARFGVPAGYGGPHAAFFSCRDGLKRKMPGRLIGLSKGSNGEKAYRLALQSESQSNQRSARLTIRADSLCPSRVCFSPRAAHPTREGDQQHLHRSGSPRQHGGHVRCVSSAPSPAYPACSLG